MEDIIRTTRVLRELQTSGSHALSSYRLKDISEMPSNMILHMTYTELDEQTASFLKQLLQFGTKKQICMKSPNMDMYIAIRGSKMRLKIIAHRNIEFYRSIFQMILTITTKYSEDMMKMLL